jgi:4-nitrophenyl phosphatase
VSPGNLICDLDGVVYLGSMPIAGSARALTELTAAGWNILMCTNNSTRSPGDVAERIHQVTGFRARPETILTSAQAAAFMLAPLKPHCFVLGGIGIVDALTDAGIPIVDSADEAEAVVVGLATDLTYSWLREAVTAVFNGARLIATNLDSTYPTETGLWPGGGAIVAAVETATGVKAEPAGKPWTPMRELVAKHLVPGPVWVAGDRPDTDLALAEGTNWRTALVLSGVTKASAELETEPDLVAPDLATVGRFLLERGDDGERL